MRAKIYFTDGTTVTVEGVDADKVKERFVTANSYELPFIVAGNLIVQRSYVRCITFFE